MIAKIAMRKCTCDNNFNLLINANQSDIQDLLKVLSFEKKAGGIVGNGLNANAYYLRIKRINFDRMFQAQDSRSW